MAKQDTPAENIDKGQLARQFQEQYERAKDLATKKVQKSMGPLVSARVRHIETREMGVQTDIQLGTSAWMTCLAVQHEPPSHKISTET